MKRHIQSLFLFMTLLLVGCSGVGTGGSSNVGEVSGIVQDVNGNVVRNARVYVDGGPETLSNSSGAYLLQDVRGTNKIIKASVTQDGVAYYGENVVRVDDNARVKSHNITVVRNSQRATLTGTVFDRNGLLVQGARVFAVANANSSTIAITDAAGRFRISTLQGGTDYTVVASAVGFNSDTDTVNVPVGNTLNVDFTLGNQTDPNLPAVNDLEGTAWTSPRELSNRGVDLPQQLAGIAAVKQLVEPRLARASEKLRPKNTTGGNWVEVDLFWTPVASTANLWGYGIYRGDGNTTNLGLVDAYRDPLAVLYEDFDSSFTENQTLSYAITSINTSTNNSESPLSNRVVVTTLGDLDLNTPLQGPLTFRWFSALGATSYSVFLFDRFPALGVSPIWTGGTAGQTTLDYSGAALQTGRTYYYVVLGQANGGTSRTISVIDSFVAG